MLEPEWVLPWKDRLPVIEIVSSRLEGDVRVLHGYFESFEGRFRQKGIQSSKVFVIIARPEKAAPHSCPGMLVCHGGQGYAEEEKAIGWAREGFVAVVPELPGWADQAHMQSKSRYRDPNVPYAKDRFYVEPELTVSGVFDSIVAGLGAFRLLRNDVYVNAARIGMTGISFGSYLVTYLCGVLGQQVRAAFALYGCGFFEKGTVFGEAIAELSEEERRIWFEAFDAGKMAARIRATMLMYPVTNDRFFYPSAVLETYRAIPGDAKRIGFGANMDHEYTWPGGTTTADSPSYATIEPVYFRTVLSPNPIQLPRVTATTILRHIETPPIPEVANRSKLYPWTPESEQQAKKEVLVPLLHVETGMVQGDVTRAWAWSTTDQHKPWAERKWTEHAVTLVSEQTLNDGQSQLTFEILDVFDTLAGPEGWSDIVWFGGITFDLIDPLGHRAPLTLTTPLFQGPEEKSIFAVGI